MDSAADRADDSSDSERGGRHRQRPIRTQSQSIVRQHHQQQQQQQQPCIEPTCRRNGSDIHKSTRPATVATSGRRNSVEAGTRSRPPTADDALQMISLTMQCSNAVDAFLQKSTTMPEVCRGAPAAAGTATVSKDDSDIDGLQRRLHLQVPVSSHCGITATAENEGTATVARFLTAASTATTVTNGFRQFAGICLTPETCV
jgi:hypothetical protein